MKNCKLFLALSSYFLALNLFAGCSVDKRIQRLEANHPAQFTLHHSDSIRTVVKQSEHDSTVYLPGQTVTQTITEPCPPEKVYHESYHKNGITESISVDSGKLTVTCHEDSLKEIIASVRDSIKTLEIKDTSGMAVTTSYQTHWYDYFCRTVIGIAVLVLLVWVGIQSIKRVAV